MIENDISREIIKHCINIHKQLGPGLLESVYETILAYELSECDFDVVRQKGIPVTWKGQKLELGFRADLIINNKVIIEIKSVEKIADVHPKQLLTYLKITNLKLGLLINFNEKLLKDGITRVVNNL